MKRDRTGLKQICFDVPQDWHAKIYARAKDQNMHLKQWILKAMVAQLKKEEDLGWK